MWNGSNNFGGYGYQPNQYGYGGYTSPSYQQQTTQQTGVNTNKLYANGIEEEKATPEIDTSKFVPIDRFEALEKQFKELKESLGG